MEENASVPILIPFDPEEFWAKIRIIIREEVLRNQMHPPDPALIMTTPGLTEKPLYKIQEICTLFRVTKPTIYSWIKNGQLKRVKIRSRVYFLNSDIKKLMHS